MSLLAFQAFYRLLYFLLKALALTVRPFSSPAFRRWIELRRRPLDKAQSFAATYWFHASSGEIEYCKSVIRRLKETHPEARVVVTYSSPSAEKLFGNIRDCVDQFLPLPWDTPGAVRTLLAYLRPQVLVFSRTDLWPELVYQARRNGVRTGVISYNPRFSPLADAVNRRLLGQLDFISCVNEEIKSRLALLTDRPVITADGDTRFDQVFFRLAQPPRVRFSAPERARRLVCGSTWPEDEAVLFKALGFFRKQNFKIILSPHEVASENIRRLQKELTAAGFTHETLTAAVEATGTATDSNAAAAGDLAPVPLTTEVLIIDQIGYLADAYRDADLAFVGGSFREKVHSVMEPLCCGLPVLVGPYYTNNPEAVHYRNRFVFPVADTPGLLVAAAEALRLERRDIASAMRQNRDASARVLKLILRSSP